jgi:hypothetical protein
MVYARGPEPKPPYSALQKDIAIGFAMAIGFRKEAYRTILTFCVVTSLTVLVEM